jgi:hypothetical protein
MANRNCFIGAYCFPEGCPKTVLLPESFAPSAASNMRSPVSFIQLHAKYTTAN